MLMLIEAVVEMFSVSDIDSVIRIGKYVDVVHQMIWLPGQDSNL